MPRKSDKQKDKKRKNSESSTSETSTQSVDDDTQELLRSGAGASGDGRKSRERTKTENRWTLRKQTPRQSTDATSSRSSPQSGHSSAQSGRCIDPESSTHPSKKCTLNPIPNVLERKSPNRSSSPNCSSEDGNHKPECSKSKNVSVDAKGSFGGARPKLNKNKDATQSFSSSDPSVGHYYFANATDSGQSSERSLLLDPNQGEAHASPQKKTFFSRMRGPTTTKELKCPEQRSHKTNLKNKSSKVKTQSPNQTTSEASASSGSSNSTSNKSSGASYDWPWPFNSKSPNKSDPKGKGPSDNKSSKASKSGAGSSRNLPDFDLFELARFERVAQQASGDSDAIIQDDTILIDQMDVERRGRIPSLRSRSQLPEPELEIPLEPTPNPYDFSDLNIHINQFDWEWFEKQKRREKDARRRRGREARRRREGEAKARRKEERGSRDRNERRDPNEGSGAAVDQNIEMVRRNVPDETERVLLRQVAAVGRFAISRHESASPVRVRECNCGAAQGHNALGHPESCVQQRDLRERRKRRKDRNYRSYL